MPQMMFPITNHFCGITRLETVIQLKMPYWIPVFKGLVMGKLEQTYCLEYCVQVRVIVRNVGVGSTYTSLYTIRIRPLVCNTFFILFNTLCTNERTNSGLMLNGILYQPTVRKILMPCHLKKKLDQYLKVNSLSDAPYLSISLLIFP